MKKKWILIAVMVLVLPMVFSLTLAGCKTTETTVAETTVAETKAAETTVAETKAAETTAGEPKTIVYWTLWNEQEPQAQVIKEWISDYKKVKPEITIDVVFVGRENLTKVMTARSGGQVIDIVDAEDYSMVSSLVNGKQTISVNEALNSPRYEGDKPWKDNFLPRTLEQYAADDGAISIINYSIFTMGFWYDKKLWRDNGWVVPKTWDELLALCNTIKTTSGIAPLTQDAGVDFYNNYWYYQLIAKLKGPGALLKAASDKTGKSWEDPAFKEAVVMIRDLMKKGYFIEGFEGFVYPNGQLMLASRDAAMELNGTWLATELKDQVENDWEWGSFQFPEVSGGVGKISDMESYLIGWVILKDSKVAPEAIDFLKFATSVENSQKYSEKTVNISTTAGINVPPALDEIAIAFQTAKPFKPYDGVSDMDAEYFKNVYLKNFNQAFLGQITPDEFIEKMKKDSADFWANK